MLSSSLEIMPPVTSRTYILMNIIIIVIINNGNTVHAEVSYDVTGNTYNSVLIVHVVSAGVP